MRKKEGGGGAAPVSREADSSCSSLLRTLLTSRLHHTQRDCACEARGRRDILRDETQSAFAKREMWHCWRNLSRTIAAALEGGSWHVYGSREGAVVGLLPDAPVSKTPRMPRPCGRRQTRMRGIKALVAFLIRMLCLGCCSLGFSL